MTKANKYIGKKASQTLYYASEMANKIQLPLNQCITINFSETAIAPLEIIKVFYKLKAKLKLWIETTTKYHKAFTFTAAWVFENCINGKGYHHFDSNHNIHVHWAIHIPRGYEDLILAQIEYYLKQMTVINDRTLHMTDTLRNLTLSYFMKGCHPDYMDLYGREQEASDQGSIPGDRRSGTTRNIAPKARKAMDSRLGIKRSVPKEQYNYVNLINV